MIAILTLAAVLLHLAPPLPPPEWDPLCSPCHGTGRGDGPAAQLLPRPPADLTRSAWLRAHSPTEARRLIAEGVPATGMPAFASLPPDRLDTLAAYAWSLRGAVVPPTPSPWWSPGRIPPQGDPPDAAIPARRSLEAARCGRCHPKEHARWSTSLHGRALGPGLTGQLIGHGPERRDGCDPCHAPLSEQAGPAILAAEGVTCAACHLRDHIKGGPPTPSQQRLPAWSQRARPIADFARSDFCLPCHDLPSSASVNGSPLLSTWREWAASPYLPAGVQCQHCHMPDGDHGWSGAHDPEAVRRGIGLSLGPVTSDGPWLQATAQVENVAVGHRFPTTATPRAVLRMRQLTPTGPLVDTEQSWAIGRTVRFEAGRWIEQADTRIIPGGAALRRYRHRRDPRATRLEASLHMFPDWYYSTVYRALLAGPGLPSAARADFQRALAAAEGSGFLVHFERRPLDP